MLNVVVYKTLSTQTHSKIHARLNADVFLFLLTSFCVCMYACFTKNRCKLILAGKHAAFLIFLVSVFCLARETTKFLLVYTVSRADSKKKVITGVQDRPCLIHLCDFRYCIKRKIDFILQAIEKISSTDNFFLYKIKKNEKNSMNWNKCLYCDINF